MKTYIVTMKDGKRLELVANHRTHAMVTAMELCDTKDPPASAVQVTDW